jgi:hypothetical protein
VFSSVVGAAGLGGFGNTLTRLTAHGVVPDGAPQDLPLERPD